MTLTHSLPEFQLRTDVPIDIHSGFRYPSGALSNFVNYPFEFYGHRVESMEGFLQGLRYQCPEEQKSVWLLIGMDAKKKSNRKIKNHTLYYQGRPMHRLSTEYMTVVKSGYFKMASQNEPFRKALIDTRGRPLRHTVGKSDPLETILTEQEFVSILNEIRGLL